MVATVSNCELGRLPALLRRSFRSRYDMLVGGREINEHRVSNGRSDKCGGTPSDSPITAAAPAAPPGEAPAPLSPAPPPPHPPPRSRLGGSTAHAATPPT